MAGNIHIENDYQNIFVVDPNKIDLPNGQVEQRNIAHEELVMYANLECNLQPRSKLIVGSTDRQLRQIGLGNINFLKPTGTDFLTTKWTDLQNQNNTKQQIKDISSELLGITQITYKVSQGYVAEFTINLEDSKGRALFESGNDSVYSAFFNLPYPIFYLTLKGWYGKAIRYQLYLDKFHGAFNSSTGNFEITLSLKSFQLSVLRDVSMTDLYAVPQMYQTDRIISSNNGLIVNNNNTQNFSTSTTFLGYDKIVEMYKKYKSRGLLPEDFPELTVQELIARLENFINTSLEELGQVSLNPLTDYEKYLKTLDELNSEIYLYSDSWFKKYLILDKPFIVKQDTNTITVYTYSSTTANAAYTDLKSIIETKVAILNKNVTFGDTGGLYNIPIKTDDILNSLKLDLEQSDFDSEKTILKRVGGTTVTTAQINDLGLEINILIFNNITFPYIFSVEGKNGFTTYIQKIKTKLNGYKEELEVTLSDKLAQVLKSPQGIGFQPTIRNIIGVLMASAEAYLLLLEDVHTKAFNQRNNLKRQQSIGGFDKKPNLDSPVYPWPQYLVGKTIDGVEKFEIQYPGDPNNINQTGANDYDVWPEVQFVEEYVRGFIMRNQPPTTPQPQKNTDVVLRNLISGFDTVPTNTPYSNLVLPNFFFEIMERLQLIVTLNGFSGSLGLNSILNFLSQTEFANMNEGLKNENGEIINMLKNGPYRNVTTFNDLLSTFQVSYAKYSNGFLTTQYLIDEVNTAFKILDKDLPEQTQLVTANATKLVQDIIKNASYTSNSLDIYPFVDLNWSRSNLENGSILTNDIIYSTKSSLFYNDFNKKIANYNVSDAIGTGYNSGLPNQPLVSLKIRINTIDTSSFNLNIFYTNREVKDYVFTEGKITCTNSQFIQSQTTSILNTPYFINAIQEGITNERNGSDYPYINASYLFLNSLPLATTKERYIFNNASVGGLATVGGLAAVVKNDFISTTLKKYSGVHALPLPWIAKLGSIWYRYKKWKENGVDILSNIWNNFDYANNYDPINGQTNTPYVIQNNTIVLQQDEPLSQGFVLGFYPKLINDFYYLVNGVNLFLPTDTTIDIQTKINDAITSKNIWLLDGSGTTIGFDTITTLGNTKMVKINTISVLVKDIQANKYVITPSFGLYDTTPSSTSNQLIAEMVNYSSGFPLIRSSLVDNNSMYNGSVRLFWGGPNYGYFDTTQFTINPPDKYLKKIYTGSTNTQTPFELFGEDEYSSIEEIFSVFSKDELDTIESIFLNYAKSPQKDTQKEKFYNVLKGILSVNFLPENITIADIISIHSYQMTQFTEILNSHISYNQLISVGNPKKYDKRIFSSVSSNPLLNTIPPGGYINGSLPTSGGTTTLSNSQLLYTDAWKTLELYVGFSTIPQLVYSDNGSFITDFFSTMNIEFTSSNIIYYQNVIKVFATKKLQQYTSGIFDSDKFKTSVNSILIIFDAEISKLFNLTFIELSKGLPTLQKINPYSSEQSPVDGLQSKVEKYEKFKSVNDSWIAGYNYNSETLFQDFLFVDRANRNIGDKVYVDVFKVKDLLKTVTGNLIFVIESIVREHNFIPFMIPGYINFYGVNSPSPEALPPNNITPVSFADSLFGTFTNVDYQQTKTKFVCMYADQGSKQLDNPDTANGYNNDGFDLKRAAQQPLVDNSIDKKDYGLSNKVVGFAVDFGLQNQSIFKNVSVSQDLGKPTEESLYREYEMANLANGTTTSTQNVSLYNLYKLRSYEASVNSFGNVMIQPNMYFILRNMPLFGGTYMITSVSHSVSNGNFETTFTGTRMSTFTLPTIDQLLQTIQRGLLQNIVKQSKISQNTINPLPDRTQSEISAIVISNIDKQANPSTANCQPTGTTFTEYVVTAITTTTLSYSDVKLYINTLISDSERRKLIYTLILLENDNGSGIKIYNNNLGNIPVTTDITGGSNKQYIIEKQFICLEINGISEPYFVFNSPEKSIRLLNARFGRIFKNEVINFANSVEYSKQFAKCYLKYFPYQSNIDYDEFETTNVTKLTKLQETIKNYFDTELQSL